MSNLIQESLHLPPVRPRFQVKTRDDFDTFAGRIQDGLNDQDANCHGRINYGYISLWIPEEDRHYWSPQLSLTLEELHGGTLVRGLYGPHPAVWTMFVFFYALIGFAIMIVAIIGFSALNLGQPAPILWLLPVLLFFLSSIYLTSYLGQRLGHDQLDVLHNFLAHCTGLEIMEEYA